MTPVPRQVIIGLDVGTTGVKAVAFGLGSPWRTLAVRQYPLLRPAPGQEVQDPAVIVTAAGAALSECVASIGTAEVLAGPSWLPPEAAWALSGNFFQKFA